MKKKIKITFEDAVNIFFNNNFNNKILNVTAKITLGTYNLTALKMEISEISSSGGNIIRFRLFFSTTSIIDKKSTSAIQIFFPINTNQNVTISKRFHEKGDWVNDDKEEVIRFNMSVIDNPKKALNFNEKDTNFTDFFGTKLV